MNGPAFDKETIELMEAADVIAGAVVLLAGMGIGAGGLAFVYRLLGHTNGRLALQSRPTAPMCSCDDPLSMHDPETKHCRAQKLVKYNELGSRKLMPCPCRRYDGPEPLPEYYATEISP